MGRKENDVFVLGDEPLATESDSTYDADLVGDEDTTREFGAESAELHEPVTPAQPRSRVAPAPRRLAVLGLSAGAATVVAISVFSAGGGGDESSSPPPQPASLVASPPPLPAVTPHKVTAPSPRPHHRAHHRVRRNAKKARDVRNHHRKESQRETTHTEAPVDSTVSVPTTVTVEPAPPPTPVSTPEPPSPPPPAQSGGGSGARAEFSFER